MHKGSICGEKLFYKKGLTDCKKCDIVALPQKGFIFLRRFFGVNVPEGGSNHPRDRELSEVPL